MLRSRLLNRWTALSDDGSASLEFLTAGFILLLPIVYLILTVSSIQAGSLAVEGAARQAARVFVQADDTTEASDAQSRPSALPSPTTASMRQARQLP